MIPGPSGPSEQQAPRGPVLIGGIGLPWLRDLDFGTQFIRRVEGLEWPENVLVEDLSFAAHRALDRLRELEPSRVVLVGCMPREVDAPGTIRRYQIDILRAIRSFDPCMPCTTHIDTGLGTIVREVNSCGCTLE